MRIDRLRTAMIVLLGVACMNAARAQTPPGSAAESRVFPFKYEVKDLANGLRIIAIPTGFPDIVSLQIPVSVGSRNEVEPGRSGFAHFFEHMMFRGTEKFPSEKYNAVMKAAGADQNAFTTDDFTNYHTTFAKEDLETILAIEADRFMGLAYPIEGFKTEARAVLGEYNKNYADPFEKMLEALRDASFTTHTYKHTTMGFIKDIEAMPTMFDYSRQFFDRYYRPERTTIIVAGDIDVQNVFALVEKHWGAWKKGGEIPAVPAEPAKKEPVRLHIPFDSETLPWVTVSFHGPRSSDDTPDQAAMDVIAGLAFSSSSPLYQKLVVKEQKVDDLTPLMEDHVDPELVTVAARVKNAKDIAYVRDEIQRTFAEAAVTPVDPARLADMKSYLRCSFVARLDNSESIASALVPYVARTRDPESLNRRHALYAALTPESIRAIAAKYFVDREMVVGTLSHEPLEENAKGTGTVDGVIAGMAAAEAPTGAPPQVTLMRTDSPLISLRLVFRSGAAADPERKEGLARLTAALLAEGSSRSKSYEDIRKEMFPIAADLRYSVDQEMTVFSAQVSREAFDAFWALAAAQLTDPAFREDDFARVREDLVNSIRVDLRSNNDEELAKEALRETIYAGHPYGHLTRGHAGAVAAMTIDDVKGFYHAHYAAADAWIGLAGGFTHAQFERVKQDVMRLKAGKAPAAPEITPVARKDGVRVRIIEKDTRATAISFGFPIEVNRAHPDFPALWLVRSWLGEHRSSNSHLYQRIREIRGMNYGDYAYIEYFPGGMYAFHPSPNLCRSQQIFEVWIRPVVPANAVFALRAARYEVDKLVKDGMSPADFDETRAFLLKFVHVLTKRQDEQLGYAIDQAWYGLPNFGAMMTEKLRALKLEDVNAAIRRHLASKALDISIVTKDAAGLRDALISGAPSMIAYDAPKPDDILAEDKIIGVYDLGIGKDSVVIVPAAKVFE